MRSRALLLALLLLAPWGCLGDAASEEEDGPRLAQPTDKPATVPEKAPRVRGREDPDLRDPGFAVNWTWSVGDGWDWDSNESNWRSLRVVDEKRGANGTRHLALLQMDGEYSGPPPTRFTTWVNVTNATAWTRLNETVGDGVANFTPPAPDVRYYRNGTLHWNETGPSGRTAVALRSYYVGTSTVKLAWGTVRTGTVEHRVSEQVPGSGIRFTFIERSASRDMGNDARFTLNGEVYTLTGVKYGNLTLGTLRPH